VVNQIQPSQHPEPALVKFDESSAVAGHEVLRRNGSPALALRQGETLHWFSDMQEGGSLPAAQYLAGLVGKEGGVRVLEEGVRWSVEVLRPVAGGRQTGLHWSDDESSEELF